MNKIFIGVALILLTASCTKNGNPITSPDSRIAFFDASEYLQGQFQSNPYKQAPILVDLPDTTLHGVTGAALSPQNPFFDGNSNEFPTPITGGAATVSWIEYLRIPPGTHTITLTDTGAHHSLVTNQVGTADGLPVSLYYSDSLGHFRTFVCRDTITVSDNAVQLRVFDLSPDAGKVFFRIDSLRATGFPDTLRYGTVTPFTSWPVTAAHNLQIYFYNAGDTTDILATAPLNATPGHAYNVVFAGYKTLHNFTDPVTGAALSFYPDLRLFLTQNY